MSEKLDKYKAKRDFEKTGEPQGGNGDKGGGLRFVVQHHIARRDHYDFRLEWQGVLLSWAVPKGPSYDILAKRLAVQVEDHPFDYRNFEGTIPKGEYGGGTVMIWDEGVWEPFVDVAEGLREGSLKFRLDGVRLKGKWALVRLKAQEGEIKENWLLIKEKDEFSLPSDGISQYVTSVRTGRTMDEIGNEESAKAASNPFASANAQLAKLVTEIPSGEDRLYELKYDGYRIIAFVENNTARLMTRNGQDYTGHFKEAAASLVRLAGGRAMVLDGEMVITDEKGKSDFQALQGYLRNLKGRGITYIVFDMLALDGEDIREQPLIDRKAKLEALLKDAPENLHYSRHVIGKGKESFAAACEAGMEGIIGKKVDSPYKGGRNGDWIKIKCDNRQEFVVGGYTLSDKKTSGVSSLLLGYYDNGELVFCGRAGSGFSERESKSLGKKFESMIVESSPFVNPPKKSKTERFYWLKPVMVAEIRFAEWTSDNLLRQASYKGMRTDKPPESVVKEIAAPEPQEAQIEEETDTHGGVVIGGVKISNADKVIFDEPKTTKADIVRYYAKVGARMMPYVEGRMLSIVRCPRGIAEACFYKKHPAPDSKGIVTVQDGDNEYFYIENAQGLLYEAQMGTLEFHTWASRAETPEAPDIMVFDLDPDEGMALDAVRQGVRDLKKVLNELALPSYLKTSGGKGYHVVVPFEPSVSWEVFNGFAKRVASVMAERWQARYTANSRKTKRTGKIFIDWMRNGRGATSIAPYSVRARKGAKVSMPIGWDELDRVAPDGIDMAKALQRIGESDPWKDFFANRPKLKP